MCGTPHCKGRKKGVRPQLASVDTESRVQHLGCWQFFRDCAEYLEVLSRVSHPIEMESKSGHEEETQSFRLGHKEKLLGRKASGLVCLHPARLTSGTPNTQLRAAQTVLERVVGEDGTWSILV